MHRRMATLSRNKGFSPGGLRPGIDDQCVGQLIPPTHQLRSSVQQYGSHRHGPNLPRLPGALSVTPLDRLDDLPNFFVLLGGKLIAAAHILYPIPSKLMFYHKG